MRKFTFFFFVVVIGVFFNACKETMKPEEVAQIGIVGCRKPAPFVKNVGFDPMRSTFNSTNTRIKGLEMVEIPLNPQDTVRKSWQHPSWSKYGYMGPIATDEQGNAYAAPIPFVNTLDNPISEINKFYKVDNLTGEMSLFCTLPKADSVAGITPFGVLGLYYDCHGAKLYAASVAGSTRDEEKGVIYVINPTTAQIEDKLTGYDAIGVCVGGVTGTKRLFYGSGRTSNVFSIELDKAGHFVGDEPQLEFTIDQLGIRGDDKVRRIRFDKQGNMNIFCVGFDYSLAAQTDVNELTYKFHYNTTTKKWVNMQD